AKLDRQVRDAQPRIQYVWRDNGTRGARLDAPAARTAMILRRLIRFQGEIGQDRPQEEPGAAASADHVGVLADPADPGFLRPILFHHRSGVDRGANRTAGREGEHPFGKPGQHRSHDAMVVLRPGVFADHAVLRAFLAVGPAVIQAYYDYSTYIRYYTVWIQPLRILHVRHPPLVMGLQPFGLTRDLLAGLHAANPDMAESNREGLVPDDCGR